MQNTYEFSDGSAITISTAKIYLRESGSWNETGIKPDFISELSVGTLPENLTHDIDSQLQKAIEIIKASLPTEEE